MNILRIILGWFLISEPLLLCLSILSLWKNLDLKFFQKLTTTIIILIHVLAGIVLIVI